MVSRKFRDRIEEELKILEEDYQEFVFDWERRELTGDFYLFTADKKLVGVYSIKLKLPVQYPYAPPDVYDDGDHFPTGSYRHIEDGGKFCLFVADESWKYYDYDHTLAHFLSTVVREFLLKQVLYDKVGEWIGPAREHGEQGRLDFYREDLGITDIKIILDIMARLSKGSIKGGTSCPCKSGLKVRDCHDILLKMQQCLSRDSIGVAREKMLDFAKAKSLI